MKPQHLLPLYSLALTLILGASPLFAQVSLVNRNSFINATNFDAIFGLPDFGLPGGPDISPFRDIQTFTQFGTFSSTATADPDLVASQTSNITNSIFDIQAFANGGALGGEFPTVEAFSLLTVTFDVSGATTFSLEGLLEDAAAVEVFNRGTAVGLTDENNNQLFQFQSDVGAPVQLSLTGTLVPGQYTFEFDSRSFRNRVLTSDVLFTLESSPLSVPEPSCCFLISGIALLATARRRRALG